MHEVVGLVPARSGSKRIVGKNIKLLAGRPLLAYSIASALESGIFGKVVVSTDSTEYADIATGYRADVLMRPKQFASETSPDRDWVMHALKAIPCRAFAILRPTSPFRTAETIKRAWTEFASGAYDSLRAVEKCHEHPAKAWTISNSYLHPVMPLIRGSTGAPGHSSQYASLPEVYIQNGSLEMAWSKMAWETGSIAGEVIRAFITEGAEGFDLNTPYDWEIAERMIASGEAVLPKI